MQKKLPVWEIIFGVLLILSVFVTVFLAYQNMQLRRELPKANAPLSYTCPTNGYINCMPSIGGANTIDCSQAAMDWYKANCPNFKGGAY